MYAENFMYGWKPDIALEGGTRGDGTENWEGNYLLICNSDRGNGGLG